MIETKIKTRGNARFHCPENWVRAFGQEKRIYFCQPSISIHYVPSEGGRGAGYAFSLFARVLDSPLSSRLVLVLLFQSFSLFRVASPAEHIRARSSYLGI